MVMKEEKLKEIQDICREKATLIMDEFYSGYYYGSDCDGTTISAAANVHGGYHFSFLVSPLPFIHSCKGCDADEVHLWE